MTQKLAAMPCMKKDPAKWRGREDRIVDALLVGRRDIHRLRALGALLDVKGHALALSERLETRARNG